MAVTTDTAKKTDKKKILKIVFAVLAIIAFFFIIKSLFTAKEEGEERREQQKVQESIDRGVTDEKSKYAEPVATTADTDDTRRYGYDVLYAHYGLRIMLTESKIYIDEPEITLTLVNESDKEFTAEVEYCVVNGLAFHPDFSLTVPAGETVDGKVILNYDKMKEIKVSKLRFCFLIEDADVDIYENSKAILVSYDRLPPDSWNASSSSVEVYNEAPFTINAGSYELENHTNSHSYYFSLISKNETPDDMMMGINNSRLFDKNGNEISSDDIDVIYYSTLPGNSLSSSTLLLNVKKDAIQPEDIGELLLEAELRPREDTNKSEPMKISFRVPLFK